MRKLGGAGVSHFASLYRAACADLALADAYQLPPDNVQYLHQLVGRAQNQLYRSQTFRWREWGQEMFFALPHRLLRDRALWLAFVVFWGVFGLFLAVLELIKGREIGLEQPEPFGEIWLTAVS